MDMKKLWGTSALSLALILGACNNSEGEGNTADAEGKTGAEVSGELDFYTSQPDVDAEQLISAFNEQYPEVDVNLFRSGTEEVISKVQAEDEAGDILADVLLVADSVTFEGLKADEMLMEYESPEAEEIPEAFVDPDSTYHGTKVMATGLVVNTEEMDEMPNSWNVLTSDAADGNIVMPSPLYSGAAAYNLSVLTRSDDFGWEFYEEIEANDPMITEGNGAVMENVSSGQQSYGMVVDYLAARAANDGSPVELVYPEEGVPVITEPIGIMEETDNAEAARAFVDFVLSEEGQEMQSEIGYTPIREGVEPPEGLKSLDEFNVIDAPVEELYENRETDKEKFDALFSK